jgi:LacI family repressor for deo operon, udp, cdd, tsx, nupC, and nupG
MADVARYAGVSTATVSHYLSGRDDLLRRMRPEVQQRVAEAVRHLGYVQNETARHLRLQRTDRICVLLPRLGIPYADKIASDIDVVARARGLSTVIVTGDTVDIWRRVVRDVEAGLADALICDADALSEAELRQVFDNAPGGKPSLVLHPTAAPHGYSVVNNNRLDALRQGLEYLRSIGRKRLAYIEHVSSRASIRRDLVRSFAADPRNGIDLVRIIEGAATRSGAVAAVAELRFPRGEIDSVVVESDFAAVTVLEELQRLGIGVPADVAVIGSGNAEEGYFAQPRLTTLGPQVISLAEATGHLVDCIENPRAAEARSFFLSWTLIRRESA